MASNIIWFGGWLLAIFGLFVVGLRLSELVLERRGPKLRIGVGIAALGLVATVAVLASAALTRHDQHFDLTSERVFTPDPNALEVIASLERPVRLTYFYRASDPEGKRARRIVELLAQHNRLLSVSTVDPDVHPSLAQSAGLKIYNAALLEADGRRLMIHSTDEIDIAIGIQRVLRERRIEICFLDGHGQYPSDNYEFHTHAENLGGHGMDHAHGAADAVIETTSHGVGRLRRSLEALGYDIRVILPAVAGVIDKSCRVVIDAGPRSAYAALESSALAQYLDSGGSALLLYDIGFPISAEHARIIKRLGLRVEQDVVIDPALHYAADQEMVAVTAYESHTVTERMSFTFYPGARSLVRMTPAGGISLSPLFYSSNKSYRQSISDHSDSESIEHAHQHDVDGGEGPHLLAAASSGSFGDASAGQFRAIIVGDADFATNSFYPYMSNNRIALAMVRWLARDEGSGAISARIPVPETVELTNRQRRLFVVWLVIVLPGLIAGLGAFVWWQRR